MWRPNLENDSEIKLENLRSNLHRVNKGHTPASLQLRQRLLSNEQPVPRDLPFHDDNDAFIAMCKIISSGNDAKLIRHITSQLIPLAVILAIHVSLAAKPTRR